MSDIVYLTEEEFEELGFEIDGDFDTLAKRAELAINLFIGNFYDQVDFDTDFESRKAAVKQAVAYQVAYLDSTGILTAEDRRSIGGMTIGRTSVSYQKGSRTDRQGLRYNLSLDAENWLRQAGFGYAGVPYDR